MLHKPTVSHDTHGSLSHDDEENTGLRHASSPALRMHFRVTGDEETGNSISKWKYIKRTDWIRLKLVHPVSVTPQNYMNSRY